MKITILFLSTTLLSTSLFAREIHLKISATYKKNNITTMIKDLKIKATSNKEFTISATKDNPFQIVMKTSIDDQKAIMFEGALSILEDNKLKLISSPKVLTMVGHEAIMVTRDDEGTFFEIKILPIKIVETKKEKMLKI